MTDTLTTEQAVAQVAEDYKQWMIGANKRRPLMAQNAFREGSDRNYSLKGLHERKFLQWEHQTWGINLGWTDDAEPQTEKRVSRWFFARVGGGTGQIKYGEPVALGYGKDPSFLRYEERTVGINLGWVNQPVFEWTLLGKATGRPVECGDRLAILNAKAGSSQSPGVLIAFDRTVGADIGWPDSRTWLDQLPGILAGLAEETVKKMIMAKLAGG